MQTDRLPFGWQQVRTMPKYTTGTSYSEQNAQIVPMPEIPKEEEAPAADNCADLEAKLRWINDKVPLKEGNIMGSQAGAGSGDFHMYRMARRREQFRWQRIEEEDHKRQEEEAFLERKVRALPLPKSVLSAYGTA